MVVLGRTFLAGNGWGGFCVLQELTLKKIFLIIVGVGALLFVGKNYASADLAFLSDAFSLPNNFPVTNGRGLLTIEQAPVGSG